MQHPPRATRRRRPLTAVAAAIVVALSLAAVLVGAAPAGAHTGEQSYLYIDVAESGLGGRIEVPISDLNTVLGLELAGDDNDVMTGVDAELERIHRYLGDHFTVGAGGETWPVTFAGAELFFSDLPEADDNYVYFSFTVDPGDRPVPRQLEIRFDPFFDEIDGRDGLLLIANDWGGGVIDNGNEILTTYDDGARSQTIDLGDTSWVKTFTASGKLGINHIQTGPDHILFVLVLLLPSVLVFTSRWQPTPTFGSSLWRVLKIVTMFTVAHSITFTLAGLDILPLPSPRIVESIIAISIAAAALHNIHPLAANKEWAISFAFGLFHGMGFASLVSGLDVSRNTQLLSLLGRNVGIEIGQAIVVLLLFPALFLLRRTVYYRGFFVVASILLAAVSVGWMIERVLEVDLGVSTVVEPVVAWPRVLFLVAGLTVVAWALQRREAAAGRLVEVAPAAAPETGGERVAETIG
ncbi:MAG: HupE/UreJ family protein [Acidimicrobiales bacterium]